MHMIMVALGGTAAAAAAAADRTMGPRTLLQRAALGYCRFLSPRVSESQHMVARTGSPGRSVANRRFMVTIIGRCIHGHFGYSAAPSRLAGPRVGAEVPSFGCKL